MLWPLVVKIVNVVLLLLFSFTLGSSLGNLSFSTLLSGSIASLGSAVLCWLALLAGAWALIIATTTIQSLQWRNLPWLILGAAIGCGGFWFWNSFSGNASAVCSGLPFLKDLCGGKVTQYVFMALLIVSFFLQLAGWRFTANAVAGQGGDKLLSMAHRAPGRRSWRFWRRSGRKGALPTQGSDDEEALRMEGGHERGRGEWSGGSSAESGSEQEDEPKRAMGRYAPVGSAGAGVQEPPSSDSDYAVPQRRKASLA